MLRDRIVCGVQSEKVKDRLLRDNELILQKAITVGLMRRAKYR